MEDLNPAASVMTLNRKQSKPVCPYSWAKLRCAVSVKYTPNFENLAYEEKKIKTIHQVLARV